MFYYFYQLIDYLFGKKVEQQVEVVNEDIVMETEKIDGEVYECIGEAKEVYDVCIEELEDFLKGCKIVESDDEEQLIFNIDDLALEPSVD